MFERDSNLSSAPSAKYFLVEISNEPFQIKIDTIEHDIGCIKYT